MTFLQHVNLERSDSLSTRNNPIENFFPHAKEYPTQLLTQPFFRKNAFIHYIGDWNRQSHHHLSFDVFFYVLIHIHTKLLLSIRPNKMPAWVKPTARPSIVQIHLNSEIKKTQNFELEQAELHIFPAMLQQWRATPTEHATKWCLDWCREPVVPINGSAPESMHPAPIAEELGDRI